MVTMRTFLTFLCLAFPLFLFPRVTAAPILVDRLIVEVSGKSYSQKQLEVYNLLRTIAMGELARSGLPSSETWGTQVESFKNEMVVVTQLENDQTRAESFLPEPGRLAEAVKALSEAQGKDNEVDAFIRRKAMSDADLAKVMTTVLRVEGYTRSRQQLTETRTGDGQSPAFARLDPSLDWFQTLIRSTAYRYYSLAKEYKELAPLR